MSLSESCRQCGRSATIPSVVPYFVIRPDGSTTHAWLHPGECCKVWMEKYRKWRVDKAYERS